MTSDGYRQSDRVNFRMPVEASWLATGGMAMKQTAQTLLVSRNGGVLRLSEKLSAGQEVTLRRQQDGDEWKSARARIVAMDSSMLSIFWNLERTSGTSTSLPHTSPRKR
jgi:hypothetical protein